MLMQRLITSLILVPLVLLIIFFAPPMFLSGIIGIVFFAIVFESWQLIPIRLLPIQMGFLLLMYLATWVCGYFFGYWLTIGLLLWCLNCIAIITFPDSQKVWGYPFVVASVFLVLLPLFVQSLIHIYYLPQGKSLLVYLLFLIWASDIGGYASGKLMGKHKLIPRVSPGKSWEGIIGGYVLVLLVTVIGYAYYLPYSVTLWLALALITVTLSIFGDLFISILKRRCHLKDTGAIIPGHGGILDRLDSLIAASPVFYFGLTFIPLGI